MYKEKLFYTKKRSTIRASFRHEWRKYLAHNRPDATKHLQAIIYILKEIETPIEHFKEKTGERWQEILNKALTGGKVYAQMEQLRSIIVQIGKEEGPNSIKLKQHIETLLEEKCGQVPLINSASYKTAFTMIEATDLRDMIIMPPEIQNEMKNKTSFEYEEGKAGDKDEDFTQDEDFTEDEEEESEEE